MTGTPLRWGKKAVLATFGTLGDVYPFIAIAMALESKGFEPTIVAPEMHRLTIEGEGFRYANLRPDEKDVVGALGVDVAGAFRIMLKNPHFILDEIYLRFLRETYEDVLEAGRGADVILTHSLLVGASQAAEMLGLPAARVALAPLHLQSAKSPPVTPGAPYLVDCRSPGVAQYNRAVRSIVRRVTRARMGSLLKFRREVGLPRSQEDFFLDFGRVNTADAVFGLFSPAFSAPQSDHPTNLIVPGFPYYRSRAPGRRELDPELEAFLGEGDAPIVFTLGSFAPEVSGDFYDRSLEASRGLGRRAVFLAGPRGAARLAPQTSRNEFICASAPHSLLFPHALCVVHHGGIGTTAEAVRAGKPQVVVPFFGDQPDHAARVVRLGLGLCVNLDAYDRRSATKALQEIMTGDFTQEAMQFALRVASEQGVGAVVDWVVDVIASSNPTAWMPKDGTVG